MTKTVRRINLDCIFLRWSKAFGYFYDQDWVDGKYGPYIGRVKPSKAKLFNEWYRIHRDSKREVMHSGVKPISSQSRQTEEQRFRSKENSKIKKYLKGISEDIISNKEPPACPKEY